MRLTPGRLQNAHFGVPEFFNKFFSWWRFSDVDAAAVVVGGLGLHLVQGPALRFRNKDERENQPEDRQDRVSPERAGQADGLPHVHERLDPGEGANVAEAGRHGGADVAVLQREDLANQEPGYRVDSEAEIKSAPG